MRTRHLWALALLCACKGRAPAAHDGHAAQAQVVHDAAADSASPTTAPQSSAPVDEGEPTADGGPPTCPPDAVAKQQGLIHWCEKNGAKHGPWVRLYDNGKRAHYETYVDGVQEGVLLAWDEHGQLTTRMEFAHGNLTGTSTHYKDGKLVTETRYGGPYPLTKCFGPDGKLLTSGELKCPPGTQQHVETGLDLSGESLRTNVTRVTCLRDGKPDGRYVDLHPGGELEVEGFFKHGEQTGPEVMYYDTGGKLAEGRRLKGKRVGTWIEYFGSVKQSENDYDMHGTKLVERSYDATGKLTSITRFKNGDVVDVQMVH